MLTCLYWFLVVAGGGYFLISFVVGEIAEFGAGVIEGVGDTIGDAVEGILSGADAVDLDAADVDLDVDTDLSPFNFRTIAMFAAGFGAGGLVGSGMGLSDALTLIPAFGSGIIVGLVAWQILRFLYKEQATTSTQPTDYVGLIGRVNVPIAKKGLGQVVVTVKLQKKNMPARSVVGDAIPTHARVHVVSMEGGVLIVKRLAQQ